MNKRLLRWLVLVLLGWIVLLAGCGTEEAPAPTASAPATKPAPPPPPPPPETSLGTLVKVERSETAAVEARCIKSDADGFVGVVSGDVPEDPFNLRKRGEHEVYHAKRGVEVYVSLTPVMGTSVGVCNDSEKAGQGKTFLVLHFEGAARRSTNDQEDVAKFQAVGSTGVLARVDAHSWLADAAGKKYRAPAVRIEAKDKRQLAFEVPGDASGLVWHDRKDLYELEPHPKAVSAPAEPEKKESPAP